MKTLHSIWNRSLNWILTTLLGLLGFSSCLDTEDEPGMIICMYGTPTASYTIKGKVTDTLGKALPDIQVIVSGMEYSSAPRPGVILDQPYGTQPLSDTLYTGEKGEFESVQYAFPADTTRYKIKFNEAADNPLYEADSVKVTFIRKDLEGGDGAWNKGNITQQIKIGLTPRQEETHE